MKRHIKKYLAFILLAFMLVVVCSCEKSSEEKNEISVGDAKYFVEFDCNVTNETKVTGESFDVGDEIGLFAYPSKSTIYGTGEFARWNIPYVKQTNRLSVVDGLNLKPIYFSDGPELPLDFVGYYPYSNNVTTEGFLLIGDISDQRETVIGSILYSNNAIGVKRTAKAVKLLFEYAMSQVIVNIRYDTESIPDGLVANIKKVTIEGNDLHTECNFHVATGDVAALVAAEGVVRGFIEMKAGVATTVATVVPEDVSDIILTIETDGYDYVARPRDITYEKGKQHTYNVTLRGKPVAPGDNIVEVEAFEGAIVPWMPGNGAGDIINPGGHQ